MQVVNNERVICFDIDKTLVTFSNGEDVANDIPLMDPYLGRIVYRMKHKPHVRLLINYAQRGAYVIVWSKNGYQWAEAVIKKLGLEKYVDLVATKPFAYCDDEPAEKWMGERVYIPANDDFGGDL